MARIPRKEKLDVAFERTKDGKIHVAFRLPKVDEHGAAMLGIIYHNCPDCVANGGILAVVEESAGLLALGNHATVCLNPSAGAVVADSNSAPEAEGSGGSGVAGG